jgi:hypothetical protein
MRLPVHAMVARNASSRRVKSGVKISVSTGAMFSMTLCFASTSHAAMSTAPTAPQGRIQVATSHSGLMPMEVKTNPVSTISTPPPRPMRA